MPAWKGRLPQELPSGGLVVVYVAADHRGNEMEANLRGGGPKRYRLINDRLVDLEDDWAWCESCNNFVSGEKLPDVVTLKQALERAEAEYANDRKRACESTESSMKERLLAYDLEVVEDRKAELNWRKTRTTGPRCLECGAAPVHLIEMKSDQQNSLGWFAHPLTGLKYVYKTDYSGCAFGPERPALLYDAEGFRLVVEPPDANKP